MEKEKRQPRRKGVRKKSTALGLVIELLPYSFKEQEPACCKNEPATSLGSGKSDSANKEGVTHKQALGGGKGGVYISPLKVGKGFSKKSLGKLEEEGCQVGDQGPHLQRKNWRYGGNAGLSSQGGEKGGS